MACAARDRMSDCDAPFVTTIKLGQKKGRNNADMRPGSLCKHSGVCINEIATHPILAATGPKIRAPQVVCAEQLALRAHRRNDLVTGPAKQQRELC